MGCYGDFGWKEYFRQNITKSVVTDSAGKYKLDSLSEGQYRVTFSILPGYFFTKSISSDESKKFRCKMKSQERQVLSTYKKGKDWKP
ncbi:MAG: hypothetical protein IPJ13_18035 [Saprospiraceae bacterium]|nr:hypothetical protein [Saprospiraceae bacterium]